MYKRLILDKLNKIDEIPTMLTISLQLEELLSSEGSTAKQIGDVISLDPALAGRVLKIANSAVYASRKRIITLQQAIATLGFSELRKVMMSIAVIKSFKNYFIDYEKFWLHSISVAYLSVEILKYLDPDKRTDEIYVCGLLHDLGILILDQYFTSMYQKVFSIASNRKYDLSLVENKILGITHAEVGAFLLTKWKLSDDVCRVVLNHHTPQFAEDDRNNKIVYLANIICTNRGLDSGSGFFPSGFYDNIWEELGLKIDIIQSLIDAVEINVEKAKEILRLGGANE